MKRIKIEKEQAGERIDKFLTKVLENSSRSQIQKMIDSEKILLNSKPTTSHYSLKEGDEIKISEKEKTPENEFDLDKMLIADGPEYLVINKPAGLSVHGGGTNKGKSLVDYLVKKYPKIKNVGEDPTRPGIVHRLDKEVSGLMVVAKTQEAFSSLKEQFKKRTVTKEYTALVYGRIEKESDRIDFPIKRSESGTRMAALPTDQVNSREAVTEISVIKRLINFTLLKVKIKTGRTHQIRVHLLAYGHPIVGDNLYSTKKTREQNKKINLGRVFLSATRLSFKDLAGERQTFSEELPEELKEVLKKVK